MFCKAAIMILTAAVVNGANTAISRQWSLAVFDDRLGAVKNLVDNGSDVNTPLPTFNKVTYPLNMAAEHGRLRIGVYLISKGARVNQSTSQGFTPLLEACSYLHTEFVKMLLQNGADISATTTDPPGYDALLLATIHFLDWNDSVSIEYYYDDVLQIRKAYDDILNILFDHCFDFKKFGEVSATRLENEGFPDQAARIFEFVNNPAPNC